MMIEDIECYVIQYQDGSFAPYEGDPVEKGWESAAWGTGVYRTEATARESRGFRKGAKSIRCRLKLEMSETAP